MARWWIGLGGNEGDVPRTFERALELLAAGPASVSQVSDFRATAAMGAQAGGGYLNAAAELESDLDPLDLLDFLQHVEARCGRVRTVRWGPRTLDLDLLLSDSASVAHPRLQVPHPHLWYRRFVLDPLADIAPDVRHPVLQRTVRELRDRLLVRPLPVELAGGEPEARRRIGLEIAAGWPDVACGEWSAARTDAAVLVLWLGPGGTDWPQLPAAARLDLTAIDAQVAAAARAVLTAATGHGPRA